MDFAATLQTWWTVIAAVVFFGILIWALSGKRSKDFKEAANLPLDDDLPNEQDSSSQHKGSEEKQNV